YISRRVRCSCREIARLRRRQLVITIVQERPVGNSSRHGGSKNSPCALVIGKEEKLVALDRASHCGAKLVLNKLWSVSRRTEIVAGVKSRVAIKLENTSVERVRSRFCDDFHLAATVVPILRIEIVRDDAEFLN